MGEEVQMSDYDVSEWEMGLPSDEDLASRSYSVIPPNLAMAFSITPERSRTIQDVNRASETTFSSLRGGSFGPNTSSSNNNSNAVEEEDRVGSSSPGSDSKKQKISDAGGGGGGDGGVDPDNAAEEGDSGTEDLSGKTLKRPFPPPALLFLSVRLFLQVVRARRERRLVESYKQSLEKTCSR
ncbi:unnamed protein product [Arabidopsis halleri]